MRIIATAAILLFFLGNVEAQNASGSLVISHLTGDFYIYTTFNYYKGKPVPANGMYLLTDKGTVLFDSPWDTTQFQPLLDSIRIRHHQEVVMCIATHFHEDRTGGLEYYRNLGLKTYTTKLTDQLSSKRGMKRAEFLLEKDTAFTIGQHSFETYFPGAGHAPDNIVIWFEKERVLYGGCLVKSVDDNDLGNLGDANILAYSTTIERVRKKFARPRYIIPGHNGWSNSNSLRHTLNMAKALQRKNPL